MSGDRDVRWGYDLDSDPWPDLWFGAHGPRQEIAQLPGIGILSLAEVLKLSAEQEVPPQAGGPLKKGTSDKEPFTAPFGAIHMFLKELKDLTRSFFSSDFCRSRSVLPPPHRLGYPQADGKELDSKGTSTCLGEPSSGECEATSCLVKEATPLSVKREAWDSDLN